MRSERGHTLFELVAWLALFGVVSGIAVAGAEAATRGIALVAAAAELRTLFADVRMQALARDRDLSIRFREAGGGWSWSVHEDGDGVRGVVEHAAPAIGVPAGPIPDPLKPGALLGSRPAVRFGASTLCTFWRNGESTGGWVVLSDGSRAAMLHVDGATGRVDLLRWNGARWRVDE